MKKRNKYGAVKTRVHGHTFDSRKEASRYTHLKMMQDAGKISDLKLQQRFRLHVKGHKICDYICDFTYLDNDGVFIVEDVKSPATRKNPVYRIKNKLMKAIHGIEIREVY